MSEDLKLPTGEQLLLSEATDFFDKLHQTETVANVKKAVENARKTYANNMVKFLNAEIAKTGPDELFLMADNVVLAKEFDNPEDYVRCIVNARSLNEKCRNIVKQFVMLW